MHRAKRILLIGPFPPPKGGVSIHIERLQYVLLEHGLDVVIMDESPVVKPDVFTIRRFNIFRYLQQLYHADAVHIHSSSGMLRAIHVMLAWLFRAKIIVTLHSWRGKSERSHRFHRWLFTLSDSVIAVNQLIADDFPDAPITVRPAFIPPNMDSEPALPSSVQNWLSKQREREAIIVVSNAYRLDRFNGEDIYGTDLCIEAMQTLHRQANCMISFAFVVASLRNSEKRFADYQQMIENAGLGDRFLLLHETDLSFVSLIEQADIVVRATNTDGDALSIREGLFLQRPVITSDAVTRPEGVTLFSNRDAQSLAAAIERVAQADRRATQMSDNDDTGAYYAALYTD